MLNLFLFGMIAKLPKVEISLYLIIWVFSFSFSFYNVFLLGVPFEISRSNYFIQGWSILSRKKDDSDDEWVLWTNFSVTLAPWIIIHVILSEIARILLIEGKTIKAWLLCVIGSEAACHPTN